MLSELAPGSLASQPDLHMLNIAGNQLMQLKGLEGCITLQSLNASGNRLSTAAALEPLAAGCPALESLDLQNNLLKDGPAVLAIVSRLPALKCLYLKGNPLVSSMSSYRKATIAAIPSLTYLDDRPVFEVERTSAEAW
jgi:dynein assembly factor 1